MVKFYVARIRRGLMKLADVPKRWHAKVKKELIELGLLDEGGKEK